MILARPPSRNGAVTADSARGARLPRACPVAPNRPPVAMLVTRFCSEVTGCSAPVRPPSSVDPATVLTAGNADITGASAGIAVARAEPAAGIASAAALPPKMFPVRPAPVAISGLSRRACSSISACNSGLSLNSCCAPRLTSTKPLPAPASSFSATDMSAVGSIAGCAAKRCSNVGRALASSSAMRRSVSSSSLGVIVGPSSARIARIAGAAAFRVPLAPQASAFRRHPHWARLALWRQLRPFL